MSKHDHDCGLHDCWRDPIGTCGNCGRPIPWGVPYMVRIPFVGTWGGIVHQHCPPTLTLITGSRT